MTVRGLSWQRLRRGQTLQRSRTEEASSDRTRHARLTVRFRCWAQRRQANRYCPTEPRPWKRGMPVKVQRAEVGERERIPAATERALPAGEACLELDCVKSKAEF